MDNNKTLFEYWHKQVQFTNFPLISSSSHVETHVLRHNCTNYDQLRNRHEVIQLDELERSRIIAIIKYQCTAQVLQRRAGILKDRAIELQSSNHELEQEKNRLIRLLRALQQQLMGRDREKQQLRDRISFLEAKNEELRVIAEEAKAYSQLLQDFEDLKKRFKVVSKRRQELAKNNQSLGGRVAHTKRFRQERDEARAEIQLLRQENEGLRAKLQQFQISPN